MKCIILLIAFSVVLWQCNAQSKAPAGKPLGDACEDCQLMFEGMPPEITSQAVIAASKEPGERLVIKGVIYKPDGKTPAAGVILYVYQTDNKGLYSPGKDQKHAMRHGHLRGWIKTNEKGEYVINTIRPASYPGAKSPQHIHPIVYEPQKGYYWIDEFLFDDDPYLTFAERSKVSNRGGSGIITLSKNKEGVLEGRRDIVLGLNVNGYK